MYSTNGHYELFSFYDGDYVEIYNGQNIIFQGTRKELRDLFDLIQKELDNSNNA